VLEARHQAKHIPDSPGRQNDGGWVTFDSHHAVELPPSFEIEFDYVFDKRVALAEMFVDESYQRPLTVLYTRIAKEFDPLLWQAVMLSDRGVKNKPARYALIDGQTRWAGGRQIGLAFGPAQIFTNLNPEQEADIFWRIQKHRHGMVSWHRFRAQLRSGDPESLAIKSLVEDVGFQIGDGGLTAVSALEKAHKSDDFLLGRALSDLREAWPELIPKGVHILGLHFFFRHYPIGERRPRGGAEIDDERLVSRLRTAGPEGLQRRMMAAKEIGGKGTSDRFMAMAIQAAYLSGGRA
jgi:hypothetical protein